MLKYKIHAFERLEVWKEIRKLVIRIYEITDTFPANEKYGLVSQMRRAVTSSGNNVAEGTSRASFKDQARYTEIAYGSMLELLSDSIFSCDLHFMSSDDLADVRVQIDRVTAMLNGLHESQLDRHEKSPQNPRTGRGRWP